MRLIHFIASNRWGGAERYALDICSEFASRGWSVTAYTRDAKVIDDKFRAAGIDLRHAPLRGYLDPASVLMLRHHLASEAPGAIVHVHRYVDAFTALAARRLAKRPDIKVVVTRHAVGRGHDTWLFRRIYRNVDAHIFVSRMSRDRFLSAWTLDKCPVAPAKVHVLGNSLKLEHTGPRPEPERGPKIAMFHGPLLPGKGIETVIDALPRLKGHRLRLRIVGTGDPDYVDSLRRRAMTRGVMEMIDWKKAPDDIYELICDSHIGVLPSVRREAFGMPNVEYMACGRPVVCSNNGAQSEYITNGVDGILVPPSEAAALADALLLLADDDDTRRRMGQAAYRKFSTALSWDHFAEALNRIYTGL